MCGSRPAPPPQIQYVPYPTPAESQKKDQFEDYQSNNAVLATARLNNGLGTIESVAPSAASTNAPTLGAPEGQDSQRVQRQQAKLAIAK